MGHNATVKARVELSLRWIVACTVGAGAALGLLIAPMWIGDGTLVVLLALLVGFLLGELVAWLNGRRWRREARSRGRRLDALERELAATQAQLAAARPAASSAVLPAPTPPRN